MSLWYQQNMRPVEWSVHHQFGQVVVSFKDNSMTLAYKPADARLMAEHLIRWAKEAEHYKPVAEETTK